MQKYQRVMKFIGSSIGLEAIDYNERCYVVSKFALNN